MRVMVVDDASSVRQRLMAGFRQAPGVDAVAEAGTGEDALSTFDEFRPDLVTLDLMLPGMTGLDVLDEIKRRRPGTEVVIFTNYPYPAFRRRCIELGANHFFSKSTDVTAILDLVRNDRKEQSPEGGSEESDR